MTKKVAVENMNFSGTATTSRWDKGTDTVVLNNSGTSPIRVDKFMLGISTFNSDVSDTYIGVIVQLSDSNGNCMTDQIAGGAGDTNAALNTLMEKWKDYVWMTDFRAVASGVTQIPMVFDLEANTKRLLEPGQKLVITVLWLSGNDTSAKTLNTMQDYAVWYQAAAQQ